MSQPQIFILSSDEPLLKNDKSQVILDKAHKDLPGANLLIFSSTDFRSSGKANLKALENELIDPGLFRWRSHHKNLFERFKSNCT